MARLEQKSWVFWSEAGARPARGAGSPARAGRSSGWQGRQMAGCGAWVGVCGGCRRVRSVLRLGGGGVGRAGGGAVGRDCWFRQLCSMKRRLRSAAPLHGETGRSHGWGEW